MRIIPVVDLLQGEVVRGIGGRRSEYRPIRSRLVNSSDPLHVARAFREQFGFCELYVADLDALAGRTPNWHVLHGLAECGLRLLVDVGLRDVESGRALLTAGVDRVIAALETSAGPADLRVLLQQLGAQRVTFSLDLQSGRPMTSAHGWQEAAGGTIPGESPSAPLSTAGGRLARQALECGVRSLIVLDLSGVGEARGVPTLALCAALRAHAPGVEIITGGGIRGAADLEQLARAGADAALVASALHDGALSPAECAAYVGGVERTPGAC